MPAASPLTPPTPTQAPATLHYDNRSISLHWITALLVAALWLIGETIDWFPKGGLRVGARSVHIVLGALLAAVLVTRLWWRSLGGGVHLPPLGAGKLDALASLAHKLLYLLLISTVVLGLANAWIRGDNLFGWFKIPEFDPGNKDLRDTVEELHGLCANVLLSVALLHAAAALMHHHVFKDDTLRRMLPGLRRR